MSSRGRDAAQQADENTRRFAEERADEKYSYGKFVAKETGTAYDYDFHQRGPQEIDATNGRLPFNERYIPKTTSGGKKTVAEINHQFARIAAKK